MLEFLDDYNIWDEITSESKEVTIDDLVFTILSHLKCQNCGMYKRNYHCICIPKYNKTREILLRYDKIRLFWIRGDCRENIAMMMSATHLKINKYLRIRYGISQINAQILGQIREDCRLLDSYFKRSGKKYRLYGPGGGCTKCKPCGIMKDPKTSCKHINKTWTSPEGVGIDLYLTFQKLGIKIEIPPMEEVLTIGMVAWNE